MIPLTAEYGLRAMVYLASSPNGPISRREIAADTQVPIDYLVKVLQALERAGLVRSRRGPRGGYVLTADANEVTVYDVVKAIAEIPRIEKCPLGISDHVSLCPLHKKLDEAAELVEKAFRTTTIRQLIPRRRTSACQFPKSR